MREWGKHVKWGMALGGEPFCAICLFWYHWYYKYVLGRSSTFIGCNPGTNVEPPGTANAEDARQRLPVR